MSASSCSEASLTSSRADRSAEGSMRMSSGASVAYENPRSGRSICMLDTPRSSRIASASTSLSASWRRTTPKSPRRNRVWTCARRRSRSKYGRTLGSRSTAINLPRPWRSDASKDECPPAPNVASMTVLPGCTASASRTSCASTGTWSVSFGCKTLGNMLRAPFDFFELLAPGGAIPDLEVVVDARDDDLPAEPGRLDQRGRDHDPALLVGVRLGGRGEEMPLHQAALLAEQVELGEPRLDEPLPPLTREQVEAAVEAARDHASVRELLADPGRKREPVLVIDRVSVFAEKHAGAVSLSPLRPTLNHTSPPGNPSKGAPRASAGPRTARARS